MLLRSLSMRMVEGSGVLKIFGGLGQTLIFQFGWRVMTFFFIDQLVVASLSFLFFLINGFFGDQLVVRGFSSLFLI